jgi:hypothetical protein
VIIDWTAPDWGGSPITSYTIYIQQSDSATYSIQIEHCDGTDATILANSQCTVPVTILRAAPYSLPWGTDVHAKVVATNLYGDSGESAVGNGAVITTTPDLPINLIEYYPDRSATTVGMTWDQAPFNGGAVIIDYRVNIAVAGGSFSILASGLLLPEYTAINLTPGVNYEFKVESRNSYSYSDYSATLSMLNAFKPEAPAAPVTFRTTN